MNIKTVREMITYSAEQFSKCRNFGNKGLQEVVDFCARHVSAQ